MCRLTDDLIEWFCVAVVAGVLACLFHLEISHYTVFIGNSGDNGIFTGNNAATSGNGKSTF